MPKLLAESTNQSDLFPECPRYRTGDIDDPNSNPTFPKPPEAIEIQPVEGGLTLFDRRFYNKLLWHAYPHIGKQEEHSVEVVRVRGNHKSIDRIDESIQRLQRTLVRINYFDRGGKKKRQFGRPDYDQVQLLGMAKVRGRTLIYTIHPALQPLMQNPKVFGRISLAVQDSFRSKYGLILYELLQARRHWVNSDNVAKWEVKIDHLRDLFEVGDRLSEFSDFSRKVLDLGCREVTERTEWDVEWSPTKKGRRYALVTFRFRLRPEEEDDDVDLAPDHPNILEGSAKESPQEVRNDHCLIPVPDTAENRQVVEILQNMGRDTQAWWYDFARRVCREKEGADLLASIPIEHIGSWAPYTADQMKEESLIKVA